VHVQEVGATHDRSEVSRSALAGWRRPWPSQAKPEGKMKTRESPEASWDDAGTCERRRTFGRNGARVCA